MILGTPYNERRSIHENKVKKILLHGFRKYAWRPVKLKNGQWAWFEWYRSFISDRTYRDGDHDFTYEDRQFYNCSIFKLRWRTWCFNRAEQDVLAEKLKGSHLNNDGQTESM